MRFFWKTQDCLWLPSMPWASIQMIWSHKDFIQEMHLAHWTDFWTEFLKPAIYLHENVAKMLLLNPGGTWQDTQELPNLSGQRSLHCPEI